MPYQPRATLDNPYGPQVRFRTEDVLPPSAYYISPDDRITVWIMTSVAAQTIYLQFRMLMPTGEVKLIPYQFSPQFTLQWYAGFEAPPWEGYLLGALCSSSNPQRGQTYISVQVMRGTGTDLRSGGSVLLQGYIDDLNILSYPTSPLEPTYSGRGGFRSIQAPILYGANLVIQAPQHTMWKIYTFMFDLQTSAAAGTRMVAITMVDMNSVNTGVWPALNGQGPNVYMQYTFSPSSPNSQANYFVVIGGPTEVVLWPQTSLQTYIANLDAGDRVTLSGATVEEWVGA